MSVIEKNYMDLTNLGLYDRLIKSYISNADASAFKTILLSTDGGTIYFYKKANATYPADTPDLTIGLPTSGTAVTLNGVDKSGDTANFYAPTTAGSNGQVLFSNGSGSPSWGAFSQYTPQIDNTNHKLILTKN